MPNPPFHPISELEHIGKNTADKLKTVGLTFAEDLLAYDPLNIAKLLDGLPRLTTNNILSLFIPQALLLRVPGVDKQYAEGLALSGFTTYSALVMADTTEVVRRLQDQKNAGKIPEAPSEDEVLKWQLGSARLQHRGTVVIHVFDEKAKPIEGASVATIGTGDGFSHQVHDNTTAEGLAAIELLRPGNHKVVISKSGYSKIVAVAIVKAHRWQKMTIRLRKNNGKHGHTIDEFEGGIVPMIPIGASVVNTSTDPTELPVMPPVKVTEVTNGQITVASLWRILQDSVVSVPFFKVSAGKFEAPPAVDEVWIPAMDATYDAVAYKKSNLTPAEYRRKFATERL